MSDVWVLVKQCQCYYTWNSCHLRRIHHQQELDNVLEHRQYVELAVEIIHFPCLKAFRKKKLTDCMINWIKQLKFNVTKRWDCSFIDIDFFITKIKNEIECECYGYSFSGTLWSESNNNRKIIIIEDPFLLQFCDQRITGWLSEMRKNNNWIMIRIEWIVIDKGEYWKKICVQNGK